METNHILYNAVSELYGEDIARGAVFNNVSVVSADDLVTQNSKSEDEDDQVVISVTRDDFLQLLPVLQDVSEAVVAIGDNYYAMTVDDGAPFFIKITRDELNMLKKAVVEKAVHEMAESPSDDNDDWDDDVAPSQSEINAIVDRLFS